MKIRSIRFINLILFFVLLSVSPVMADDTIKVIGENAQPLDGKGTLDEPFRYLIDEDTKVAWKHFADIRENGVTEIYEFRNGQTKDGRLNYSYTFNGMDISAKVSGPYFLELRKYEGEAVKALPGNPGALYFSFATKRDFPGEIKVTINVADHFSDGTMLGLTYYGGYDSSVVHGEKPPVAQDEILRVDSNVTQIAQELLVQNGLVVFDVRYGGNYVLHTRPLDFSGFGVSSVQRYDAKKVLGSINTIFGTKSVAEAIAKELGKTADEMVTQGEIDSIKSLYLSGFGLKDTQELSRVSFSKLESLTLSNNEIEIIDNLSMPNLSFLDASNNRITSVNAVANLKKIEHIQLSDNRLTGLPDMTGLDRLQTMDLSDNRIIEIPDLKLPSLRYLNLRNNAIQNTSASLEGCPHIETILTDGQSVDISIPMKWNTMLAAVIILFLLGLIIFLARSAKRKHKAERNLA